MRKLVELIGGALVCNSKVGEVTEFFIRFNLSIVIENEKSKQNKNDAAENGITGINIFSGSDVGCYDDVLMTLAECISENHKK